MKRTLALVVLAAVFSSGCWEKKPPVTDPTLEVMAAANAAAKKIKKVFIIPGEPVPQ
jgi:hypothetical protein